MERDPDSPVSAAPNSEDERFDLVHRPRRFKDFIGQTQVKTLLNIGIKAVKQRGEALEHTLIYGPPGLGKTTIASIIANERGVAFRQTAGPVIERRGDVAALLTQIEPFSVLFIDEIHRLPAHIEEILYPAMEDFKFDILIGEGPSAQAIRIDLKPFTLIGATTRTGMLTSPLRDRFGHQLKLDFYDDESLKEIVNGAALKLKFEITEDASMEIAKRARGTPRVALRLLKRVRDYAQVERNGIGDLEVVQASLELQRVDSIGLDENDTKYLVKLIDQFNGLAGLETMAAAMYEETSTIEEVIEPFLLQRGFIEKTPRGRAATDIARRHFHRNVPPSNRQLFDD